MIIKSSGGGENKKELTKESDNYFSTGEIRKWQGLNAQEELGKVLTNSKDTNIYKLFFKSEVIQNEGEANNGKGIKGAITLAKISSKGESESQIQLEEISKEEAGKIWLIIAKGEETNSIYLMPSVFCNGSGNNEKKIWKEGVKSIGDWTGNSQLKDEALKKSLKEGFAVVRGGRNIMGQGLINEVEEIEYQLWFQGKQTGISSYFQVSGEAETKIVYNNAGIVLGKKGQSETRRWSFFVAEEWNSKVEDFFPLDIKVVGEKNKLEEQGKGKKRLMQEVQVNEKISEVVAVKLDQVVITETGIGRGVGKEVEWGNVNKPIWTSTLLK